ncbi:MAG: glycoside-pentoside-hexuronide (GPH):cation symporter [Oscillospiraceae bacterium]|nr:glycoside-pentoside-hexuronide (GPH):cation symporter [Oscillospiraceae bacterium]
MPKTQNQTGFFERLSYGGFFLGQNIIFIVQFQYLSFFFTDSAGIGLTEAAFILTLTKIFSAVIDPIMGGIVDKTNFKGGKYLPWIRFATFALPPALILVFTSFPAALPLKITFAALSIMLWDMLYTISDSPLFSLSTVMASDVFERDRLLSNGRFAAALAAISTAVFISLKGALSGSYTLTVAVYCAFAFLVMLPLQFTAKERVQHDRSKKISFFSIYKQLPKNKYLLFYLIGFFLMNATNTLQIVAAYFAKYNLGDENKTTLILAVSIVPVLVAAPFLPSLIKWFGKKPLTIACCAGAIVLSVIQYFVGYGSMPLFLVVSAVRVLIMQIPLLIYGMFTADCVEYGAYVNKERHEGTSFALQTFATKLSGAAASAIALAVMGIAGFAAPPAGSGITLPQTASALNGIWAVLCLVPTVGYLCMIVIMTFFYKLKENDVARMTAEMREREAEI